MYFVFFVCSGATRPVTLSGNVPAGSDAPTRGKLASPAAKHACVISLTKAFKPLCESQCSSGHRDTTKLSIVVTANNNCRWFEYLLCWIMCINCKIKYFSEREFSGIFFR